MEKSIFASKTFWANVVSGAALFMATPELPDMLGPNAMRYTVLAQAGLNILLRFITTQPVSSTGAGRG